MPAIHFWDIVTSIYQVVSASHPLPVELNGTTPVAEPVTYVDRSIAAATGASQAIVAANPTRAALQIVNNSVTDWVINPMGGVAELVEAVCFVLQPGDSWSPTPVPTNAITGLGTGGAILSVVEG